MHFDFSGKYFGFVLVPICHINALNGCHIVDWRIGTCKDNPHRIWWQLIEESSIDLHLSSQLIFKGLHSCWHLRLHQWLKLKVNSGGYPICGSQKLQQALLVLPMSSCEMSQNKSFLLWKPSWDSEEGYCLHVWSLESCYPILMNHISCLKLWCLVNPMKLKLLWHFLIILIKSYDHDLDIIWSQNFAVSGQESSSWLFKHS